MHQSEGFGKRFTGTHIWSNCCKHVTHNRCHRPTDKHMEFSGCLLVAAVAIPEYQMSLFIFTSVRFSLKKNDITGAAQHLIINIAMTANHRKLNQGSYHH